MHNMQNFLTALQGGDRAAAVASPVSDENHDGNSPTSPPSKAAAGSADRKTQKQSLNGGVNFVLGDIDDAHSLVRNNRSV